MKKGGVLFLITLLLIPIYIYAECSSASCSACPDDDDFADCPSENDMTNPDNWESDANQAWVNGKIESKDPDTLSKIRDYGLYSEYGTKILTVAQSDPSVMENFKGKHKEFYAANPAIYKTLDWSSPKLHEFNKEASGDVNFVTNTLSAEDRHDMAIKLLGTGKNWEYGIIFLKALFKDIAAGTSDGSDLDFSSVPSNVLQETFNTMGVGYDLSIGYPEGTEVKYIDGALIIGGNVINIESMKGAKHTIILAGGKVLVDGIDAYGAVISADSETIIFEEGAFSFHDIEAANVNFTYINPYAVPPLNLIQGDYAEILSMTNIYLPTGVTQYIGLTTHSLNGFLILPDGTIISDHADSLNIMFTNIHSEDIHNFTHNPDGTLQTDYVTRLEVIDDLDLHSIYTDMDLQSLEFKNAHGMTIAGSNAFIEKAEEIIISRIDYTTGNILTATLINATGVIIRSDGSYEFENASEVIDAYKSVTILDIINGKLDPLGNYIADHANLFQFGNKVLTNVTNLEYIPEQLKFIYDAEGHVISISPVDYTIKTDAAQSLSILDLYVSDLLESELTIIGNIIVKGNITSGDENNSFQIHYPADINLTLQENMTAFWDSRVMPFSLKIQGLVKAGFLNLGYFIAYEPEGNLLAWFEPDHVDYITNNGIFVIDKISPTTEDMMDCPNNQTCKINVSYNYGFTCGEFPVGGSYQYNHSQVERSFREISQKDSYTICTRKYPQQSFQDWDILNDIPNQATTISGNMTYEKYLDNQMRPIHGSISDNNVTLTLSANLENINSIRTERTEIDAITRHGHFEIIEDNSTRFVKVNQTEIASRAIKTYQTFNYTNKITISDHLFQDNGDSYIYIYEPGAGSEEIQRIKDYV